MLLEGIFLPLTTPFYPDGRVYLRKLEHNVARYSLTPAAGMLVLGEPGEADGLTDAEAREVLRSVAGAAAKEKVLMAGVGRGSVAATLELAEVAATAEYDALAVRAPEWGGESEMRAELLTYFQAVSDRAPLPVVLLAESRELSVEVLAELAGHPQVIGVIDRQASPARMESLKLATAGISREVTVTTVFAAATRRMLRPVGEGKADFVSAESLGSGAAIAVAAPVAAGVKTRVKRVGFQVLGGGSRRMLDAWQAGVSGAVPRLGACAPQGVCEVWQAFKDGDAGLAAEKQERLQVASELVEGWQGIAALKHGCDWNGYFGGRPRLPLVGCTAEQREAMERALGGMRN